MLNRKPKKDLYIHFIKNIDSLPCLCLQGFKHFSLLHYEHCIDFPQLTNFFPEAAIINDVMERNEIFVWFVPAKYISYTRL